MAKELMEFVVEYCESCSSSVVICPKCGNSSCTNNCGVKMDDCEICPLTLQYSEMLHSNENFAAEVSRIKSGLANLMEKYK